MTLYLVSDDHELDAWCTTMRSAVVEYNHRISEARDQEHIRFLEVSVCELGVVTNKLFCDALNGRPFLKSRHVVKSAGPPREID